MNSEQSSFIRLEKAQSVRDSKGNLSSGIGTSSKFHAPEPPTKSHKKEDFDKDMSAEREREFVFRKRQHLRSTLTFGKVILGVLGISWIAVFLKFEVVMRYVQETKMVGIIYIALMAMLTTAILLCFTGVLRYVTNVYSEKKDNQDEDNNNISTLVKYIVRFIKQMKSAIPGSN